MRVGRHEPPGDGMRRWGRRRAQSELERSLVWMVGSPRTGSTWLLNLLACSPNVRILDEPLIGAHLGLAAGATVGDGVTDSSAAGRAIDFFGDNDNYFFSRRYRDTWQPGLKALLLDRLGRQFHDLGGRPGHDRLVIKEPHGSEAADLLCALTPESRLLVLVRDGRDVVDSALDALRPGSWASGLAVVADEPAARLRFVGEFARLWVERMTVVRRAQEAHDPGRQLLIRYEDLLADTQAHLQRILEWLRLPVPVDLPSQVDRLSFANMQPDKRGEGKFARAASPGLWRTRLTTEEQGVATNLMRPMLEELRYSAE